MKTHLNRQILFSYVTKNLFWFYELLALYLVLDKLKYYLSVLHFGGLGLFSFLIGVFQYGQTFPKVSLVHPEEL